ncbi:hypothetical protein O3M35_011845 [Rhynocoris fuscipes]|uniref:DNA-directed RNA polymerase II subunit GRINL1A n=1 Tax=Rhynocoris fuscipes TaxID=488301 RepID=A0AAW1CZL2_9HEMI
MKKGSTVFKNESKSNKEDITKLPKYRLLELLDRQKKLLSNRAALERLPDKGAKIKQAKKEIEDELEKRSSSTDLSNVMAGLTLSAPQINALEWTKSVEQVKDKFTEELNDNEENPFRILASHSGTSYSKKTIRKEEKPEELITEKDIEEIYAQKLCDKIDHVQAKEKFLPHKTLNNKYCSKKSPTDFKPENLCSASEPPSKYGTVKTISLETSIKLQFEQAEHLKEVQLKHAAERLKDKTYTIGSVLPPKEKLLAYRDPSGMNSDSENDEEEFHEVEDECVEEDREGIVTYHVTD